MNHPNERTRRRLEHEGNAQELYAQYRLALAKVDRHEREAYGRAGGNPNEAARALSDHANPKDWVYKALVGAKNSLRDQLVIEIAMAEMLRP